MSQHWSEPRNILTDRFVASLSAQPQLLQKYRTSSPEIKCAMLSAWYCGFASARPLYEIVPEHQFIADTLHCEMPIGELASQRATVARDLRC
jgi:hypothetical protein